MKGCASSPAGAVMIIVVVSMVAAAALGTALLSVSTASRYERLAFGAASRAYYLAESGAEFVRSHSDRPARTWTNLTRAYTLQNRDRFEIVVTPMPGTQGVMRVVSTGIAYPGTPWEARQRVTFEIKEGLRTSDQRPEGLFDDQGNFNAAAWDISGGVQPSVKQTGPSQHQCAIDIQGTQGYISRRWADNPNTSEDESRALCRAWQKQTNMLSYDVQVKVAPFENPGEGFGEYFMLGISFRLQTNGASFGLSFFRADRDIKKQPAWAARLPSNTWWALRGTNTYVVLWHRTGTNANFTLLRSKMLTTNDSVLKLFNQGHPTKEQWALMPYSTLIIRLVDRWNGPTRQNMMYAFIQSTNNYPNWPDNNMSYAQWPTNEIFPEPIMWDQGFNWGVSTQLRGTNDYCRFKTVTNANGVVEQVYDGPPEIGLHVFYDQEGANKKFFDDFAVFIPGSGLRYSASQIQY